MATFITTQSGSTSFLMVESTTEYIKINSTIHQSNGEIEYTLDNPNGEYTLVSCLNDGTPSGEITYLGLSNNQIISFDGTGLSGLTGLDLAGNPLVSFNGGDMSQITTLNFPGAWNITTLESFSGGNMTSLTSLYLQNNQLTSFDGIGLSGLTLLDLSNNQLTSFDGTGLSSLTTLFLNNNQLTSIDITGLFQNLPNNEFTIRVENNNFTPLINNSLISQLVDITANFGQVVTSGGRTAASEVDYQELVDRDWDLTGLDLVILPTFITSKAVNETIFVDIQTSTGWWKYQHNGNYYGPFDGSQSVEVLNANGEFVVQSCDDGGNVSGDITYLYLNENQLTSFDGTGLTSLTVLGLVDNQLTSFDGTGLSSLTQLYLGGNQLTSFDGTGLSSLTNLYLQDNQLTSFDGTGLSSLGYLALYDNQLTSFDVAGLTSLVELELSNNQLTSFDGTGLTSLTNLYLGGNQLTSFDGTGLTSLIGLFLYDNQLTSFDGTGLTSLTSLSLNGNQLTPQVNNSILNKLATYGLENGIFGTSNGRTSASEVDYQELVARGWTLEGLDLVIISSGKLRIKGVNTSRS
jgi:Leucine-rich repeat (LRR) protein